MSHSLPSPRLPRRLRQVAAAALLAALGGCANLPSSGPTARAIVSASKEDRAAGGFPIVELTPEVIAGIAPSAPGLPALAALPAGADVGAIGPGDVLQISVFEVGAALFSRSGGVAPAAPAVPAAAGEALPAIVVAADGQVSIPYVGRLMAAGLTPDQLAAAIEAALAKKSQAPQVVVSIKEPLANTVLVMGDVRKPGRILLTPARERLLDALALAGGAANPTLDNTVRLVRGDAGVDAPLAGLKAGDADDILLRPHDRLEVTYRPRTFTVFGATGKVQEVPFQTPRLSLAEALARAGGPSEQLADPTAVFVFRFEPSSADGAPAPGARPVAYRLNLQRAQGYFLAQTFEMKGRDVLYVAGAESNQPAKLLQILNLIFQPIYTGKVLSQ